MIFNICEALKNRDKQNDCKYDFLTTYQCNKYSNNTKKELIESLNNNCSDKKLEFILSRTANTEKIDLSEKFLEQFDSLDEKNSEPLNIHYYALVNTVKENGISKPTILNVCTASSIDKALMFLDPVDSEHVIEISEQKYDDYFKGQDILDEGAIWDAVKNGVKGVADAVKNINAERKNTDSYRIKQEIKDKKKDLRVAKEMEKAAKDSAKYGYHSSDSSNQSNNSAYSNSTSNDTNNNSNSTSFKAGSNPTFNRSRTSSNPSREEVLSPELIQQLIDSGDEATLQNIKIQAEKARQEAKKNNDKLEAEEKARKKQEEEKARKAAEADRAAAEAQSSNTNQNEEFTKMGGNLTESESLKESLNLNEAKNIINVLNKNLRVRFKHSAGGIFSLDRTPFNEDTFNKLIKNNYKMIGDILEEQGLKYDISEDAYISNDRNLYVTIYGDTGTVIVQFDEMESESLNESNNAVYDMYKNQYKNLLQDIKYVLNSDNIEDIRAYDKESQGEYILSKLFDSRMNKQNMSFEDAKEDVIDFLYRTRADAKSELELRNKRSLESKSIMNKVKSELSKDYKLVSESENTLYFKAPDNSTHDDCIAFVDKVVAVSGGKYTSTGRGGSWTLWDILTPEGSYIKAGYDYSNKDNYAVYFKSILTESRSTRSTSKESVDKSLKESDNSLNEDTQLKFDDDMINDIEVLYMWRPEEVERILIKHGSDKNNDNWIDGLDLHAAYDEIMSTFRDEYSDYDEIDYDVAKVLGLEESYYSEEEVDESLNERKDSVSKDDRDDIIFRLRKLSTEASEALHKYESLGNLEECRDILYYLVNDSRRLLDFVNDLLVSRKSESMQLPRIGDKKKALSSNINQNEEFTNMNDIFKALNEADYCIKLTEDLSQEEIHTSGISAYITDAINGEYDTINDYNEMLLALKDDSQDSAISVIEDIIKEEYTHIGQLQELLKMYASPSSEIKSGEVEAQKQIEETKDDQSDSEFDNEFGLNSGFDSFI